MNDPVEPGLTVEDREAGLAVGDIQLVEREVVTPLEPIQTRALQRRIVVIVQVIDPDDARAPIKKRFADVVPDEPGRAGD